MPSRTTYHVRWAYLSMIHGNSGIGDLPFYYLIFFKEFSVFEFTVSQDSGHF